jgi:putative membrane protein
MEAILASLTSGLPVLILHFSVTLTMLAVGVVAYEWITPYRELQLVRQGNTAAAIALSGAILSLAIPLAFCMAVSVSVLDIVVWGMVTLVIMLVVYRLVDFLLKDLPARITNGEIGAAILLSSVKLSIATITAAAVSG